MVVVSPLMSLVSMNVTVRFLWSTFSTSPSITSICRFLCRAMNRVGSMIDRASSVPTVTDGSSGEKRKSVSQLRISA